MSFCVNFIGCTQEETLVPTESVLIEEHSDKNSDKTLTQMLANVPNEESTNEETTNLEPYKTFLEEICFLVDNRSVATNKMIDSLSIFVVNPSNYEIRQQYIEDIEKIIASLQEISSFHVPVDMEESHNQLVVACDGLIVYYEKSISCISHEIDNMLDPNFIEYAELGGNYSEYLKPFTVNIEKS